MYKSYYDDYLMQNILQTKYQLGKPLPSSLKYTFDIGHLLCIVFHSNLKDPRQSMLYKYLDLIRFKFNKFDGGMSIKILRGIKDKPSNNVCSKLFRAIFKPRKDKNAMKKYKYFFLINLTDSLLIAKAREMKLLTYDLKENYFASYNTVTECQLPNIQPLRLNEKLVILHSLIAEQFSLANFVKQEYVKAYFTPHQYMTRKNLVASLKGYFSKSLTDPYKFYKIKNWHDSIKWLTPYSLLSFYHGLPQGFYYAFLTLYTAFLSLLTLLTLLNNTIANDFFVGTYWNPLFDKDSYLSISQALITSFWSFFFLNMWKRREKELCYSFGTHLSEVEPEIRQEYTGRTLIQHVTRKIVKDSSVSSYAKMLKSSIIIILGLAVVLMVNYMYYNLYGRESLAFFR